MVDHVLVFALTLGFVQRAVRVLEELRIACPVRGIERRTDADGKGKLLVSVFVFAVQIVNQALTALLENRDVCHVAKQYDELVAADASLDVGVPEIMDDRIAHVREDSVAEEVAKGIVDSLKPVGVDQQHGRLIDVPGKAGQIVDDALFAGVLVQQSGQLVMRRLAFHALLPELLGLNVADVAIGDDRLQSVVIGDDMDFRPEIVHPAAVAEPQLAGGVAGPVAVPFEMAENGMKINAQQMRLIGMDERRVPEHAGGAGYLRWDIVIILWNRFVQIDGICGQVPAEVEAPVKVLQRNIHIVAEFGRYPVADCPHSESLLHET